MEGRKEGGKERWHMEGRKETSGRKEERKKGACKEGAWNIEGRNDGWEGFMSFIFAQMNNRTASDHDNEVMYPCGTGIRIRIRN